MSNTSISALKLETTLPAIVIPAEKTTSEKPRKTADNIVIGSSRRRLSKKLHSHNFSDLKKLLEQRFGEDSEGIGGAAPVKEAEPPTGINVTTPELIERGIGARFLYIPFDIRTFIYTTLDIDGLFDERSLGLDETKGDPVFRRRIRNNFSVPLYQALARREEIRSAYERCGTSELRTERISAMNRVLEILDEEQQKFDARFKVGVPTNVTAEELTILLSSKERLFSYTQGEVTFGFQSQRASIKRTFMDAYVEVVCHMYINNGKSINRRPYTFKIPLFAGEKSLIEIGIMMPDEAQRAALIERGKKYVAICSKPSYMGYTGQVARKNYWGTRMFKGNGRIMVDMMGMRNMDQNYGEYFGFSRYDNDEDENQATAIQEFTDDMYAMMPAVVYGFSFISKVWGELEVDKIQDIIFREDAYDMLVMDEERKKMVFALVNNTVGGAKDFIDGKGGGCVFLLAGPPGGGKTLTAEAVSEAMGRPLYMVGVGELGTDVTALEDSLRKILDVATTWNAVLLIDECDIFMEARNEMDVERNAMVGVFLRLLEYYEGVLFLTTNRAENIDPAFYSRISMAMYYEPLNAGDREIVWGNLLRVYGVNTEKLDLKALASHDLNGRKIKGVIRIASALASADNRIPAMADFINVIDRENEFQNQVKKK